jgi:hypothetical protein
MILTGRLETPINGFTTCMHLKSSNTSNCCINLRAIVETKKKLHFFMCWMILHACVMSLVGAQPQGDHFH